MNTRSLANPFSAAIQAPRDPVAGITEMFLADSRPDKLNLGVGVYTDESGKIPLLDSVRSAQEQLLARSSPSAYLPIDGLGDYLEAVQRLVLGSDNTVIAEDRAVTMQTPGGTGALRLGADLLFHLSPGASVLVSDPSWENHRGIFKAAGLRVGTYPYFQPAKHNVDIERMLAALDEAPAGTIVVLHACCHNPTGCDLSPLQWQAVARVMEQRGLVPFLDMAYQGFAEGIEKDAEPVRLLAASGHPVLVASSFSKNLSLYGERVGALTVVASDRNEAARLRSQLKQIARVSYSNPPGYGAKIAQAVLTDPRLQPQWITELDSMRLRIKQMRLSLVQALHQAGAVMNFNFMIEQQGMFSYSGLSSEQVQWLRDKQAIYLLDTGRLCLAALQSGQVMRVAGAMVQAMGACP